MLALRIMFMCGLALSLASCQVFDRENKKDDDAEGASAAKVDETRARYRLEVQAPRALKRLLADNLDLARFRDAPESDGLQQEELDRLIAAAPEQARALLATEGYFGAQVRVSRQPVPAGALPSVLVQVEPGPRTQVESVTLGVQGELKQRADAGQSEAAALLPRLRDEWPLPAGEPFRQADWTGAKNATLARLHAEGYPTASWLDTQARVRSKEQRVQLEAQAQSGPLFHFGELPIGEVSLRIPPGQWAYRFPKN